MSKVSSRPPGLYAGRCSGPCTTDTRLNTPTHVGTYGDMCGTSHTTAMPVTEIYMRHGFAIQPNTLEQASVSDSKKNTRLTLRDLSSLNCTCFASIG